MKTFKGIIVVIILFILANLMMLFAFLNWIFSKISIGFAYCTYKIANDALDLINGYLKDKDENPYVKLLK